ncbi:HNH endonuclease [Pseudomonas sp. NPDC089396]|uniref:HNH endonuclease n=1 Tax=Pseudomonas sp. NPDC089396 TaxID=3364461 RepID=UPI003835B156
MPRDKAFYKSLGHELMKELAATISAELISGGALGAYETVELPNGMHVRFTSWRGGGGPFYIILFKGAKYVFELDLSMIVHQWGRFTWHLKVPSHEQNVALLEAWLGACSTFDEGYSQSVKGVKRRLESGVNTPRTGYRFIDDAEWSVVCEHFLELMSKAIKAHTTDDEGDHQRAEARDDDGSTVMAKRRARRNQSRFRLNLMELYDSACAISGECVGEVLEAAHIVSHSETGLNHTGNGLLLRSDLHRLFDRSLIAVDPKTLNIVVSPLLAESGYQRYSGKKLRSRIDGSHPDPEYLERRWTQAGLEN